MRTFDTVAVDTSALVAIFLQEDDPVDFAFYLSRFHCLIGWPVLVEFHTVMTRKTDRDDQHAIIDFLDSQPNIRFVEFGADHFKAASAALVRFGRGRHPANLNLGDCLSYAVAKVAGVPMLFKGDDFARTDLTSAVGLLR